MKKRRLFYAAILLTACVASGCVNEPLTETTIETTTISSSQEATTTAASTETESQNEIKENFVTLNGRVAMLTEDVTLKDPYLITVNSEMELIYQGMENIEVTLHTNDMVIVIEENESECRIIPSFGDLPRPMGTIEKGQLTYDEAIYKEQSNQAILDNVMVYDAIDGNEVGLQNAIGEIIERKEGWVHLSLSMEALDFWVEAEDLSYEFGTQVTDIEQ
jgi:outer membrane murein-binding lipoprotein Lpp